MIACNIIKSAYNIINNAIILNDVFKVYLRNSIIFCMNDKLKTQIEMIFENPCFFPCLKEAPCFTVRTFLKLLVDIFQLRVKGRESRGSSTVFRLPSGGWGSSRSNLIFVADSNTSYTLHRSIQNNSFLPIST